MMKAGDSWLPTQVSSAFWCRGGIRLNCSIRFLRISYMRIEVVRACLMIYLSMRCILKFMDFFFPVFRVKSSYSLRFVYVWFVFPLQWGQKMFVSCNNSIEIKYIVFTSPLHASRQHILFLPTYVYRTTDLIILTNLWASLSTLSYGPHYKHTNTVRGAVIPLGEELFTQA